MIVRHLHTVYELLGVLAQPTNEMLLRHLLTEQERFLSRRTWERRMKARYRHRLAGSVPDRPDPALDHVRASSRHR